MSDKSNEAQAKYTVNTDYVLREIVGEFMLIPTGRLSMTTNEVVTISESAAYLWEKMDEGKTIQELCEILRQEYDVDSETASSDVTEMIDSMYEREIVKKLP